MEWPSRHPAEDRHSRLRSYPAVPSGDWGKDEFNRNSSGRTTSFNSPNIIRFENGGVIAAGLNKSNSGEGNAIISATTGARTRKKGKEMIKKSLPRTRS